MITITTKVLNNSNNNNNNNKNNNNKVKLNIQIKSSIEMHKTLPFPQQRLIVHNFFQFMMQTKS